MPAPAPAPVPALQPPAPSSLHCYCRCLAGGIDEAPPSQEEMGRVAAIMAEQDGPGYWFAASRDGHREVRQRRAAPSQAAGRSCTSACHCPSRKCCRHCYVPLLLAADTVSSPVGLGHVSQQGCLCPKG